MWTEFYVIMFMFIVVKLCTLYCGRFFRPFSDSTNVFHLLYIVFSVIGANLMEIDCVMVEKQQK